MEIDCAPKQTRYEETRKRLTRFRNQIYMSDKEIIEYLAEELEYYRDKIKTQELYIKKIQKKAITLGEQCDRIGLKFIEKVDSNNIQEKETINVYADEKLIQSIIKHKYKEKLQEANTPPKISI